MRVIVIGAGVSGLTCAAFLRDAGVDVSVVEARDRIGGRVWTGHIAGHDVDLGGAWIHGPVGNPLAEFCRDAGLEWASDGAWGSRMQVHASDGSLLSQTATTSLVAAWSDFDPAEAADDLDTDATFADAVEWYIANRTLTGEPAEAVRFSLSWLEGGLNIGADPAGISARGAAAYRLHGGGNVVLAGGYRSLVDHLARSLDISLEEPVLAVEHGANGVIVSTNRRSLSADHVVVTVPVAVLSRGTILFQPNLPGPILAAARRLRLSTVEKIVLRYRERWWPEDVRRLVHVTAERHFPAWMDLSAHVGAPTLVGFFNPALSNLPEDPGARLDLARASLATMLGKGPKPIAAMITDWRDDPYAGGAYSYIPTGASSADMDVFGRVDGPVLFAGEHTVAEYHGTVQAAFGSGRRAATQLLER
ncbi:MAG: NAD(P)/FAD-dependent oxidoreductase [Acidimicrobiia bacterium]